MKRTFDAETYVPRKLTPDVADRICEGLALGMKWGDVACYAGVSLSILLRWRKLGLDDPDGPMGVLVKRMLESESEAVAESIRRVRNASDVDWRAAAWLLERRFGYSAKVETTAQVHVTTGEAREKLDDLVTRIAERLAANGLETGNSGSDPQI